MKTVFLDLDFHHTRNIHSGFWILTSITLGTHIQELPMAVDVIIRLPFVFITCVLLSECDAWLLTLFKPQEICYKKFGCFKSEEPFTNTNGILPERPHALGVRFLLYTRKNPRKSRKLRLSGTNEEYLDVKNPKPTKVIIHGYVDRGRKGWVRRMTRELMKNADVNVLVVDWRKGAMTLNYLQAAANTRLVGVLASLMIEKLHYTYSITPSMIHIIGHSLGAHIAGYIGERVSGIARITGLDPAGPAFEGTHSRVRLDPTDADFVDVIHTDSDSLVNTLTDLQPGFGSKQPMGHMDFYPNNGSNQPGCPNSIKDHFKMLFSWNRDLVYMVTCNHLRVLQLFTESINTPCQFKAYPCTLDLLGKVGCGVCGKQGCVVMGYHAKKHHNRSEVYSLATNSKSPYCLK